MKHLQIPKNVLNSDWKCDVYQLFQGYTEEEGKERAEKIFETLDKNGDGSLAEDEFIKVSDIMYF